MKIKNIKTYTIEINNFFDELNSKSCDNLNNLSKLKYSYFNSRLRLKKIPIKKSTDHINKKSWSINFLNNIKRKSISPINKKLSTYFFEVNSLPNKSKELLTPFSKYLAKSTKEEKISLSKPTISILPSLKTQKNMKSRLKILIDRNYPK